MYVISFKVFNKFKILYLCLIIFLVSFCFGCSKKAVYIKKADGDSLTYLFFKDFDVRNYYVSFYDRNVSKNDDTMIIYARSDDKYFYEYKGENGQKIIQMDGFKYTINEKLGSFFKEESEIEDYSYGVLPNNLDDLKTMGYKKGKSKVFGSTYDFEEYKLKGVASTYYFRGKKLIYVKTDLVGSSSLLKFDSMKRKFSKKIFDINNNYNEMSY